MVGTSGWGEGGDQRSYAFPLWLWSLSTFTMSSGFMLAISSRLTRLEKASPLIRPSSS
ncbi:MAG: hypothetical protein ING71_16260 [Rhodocyclaceae bacterium]|nr:hypothetical protein [Rhodocyclaceae bacterium]